MHPSLRLSAVALLIVPFIHTSAQNAGDFRSNASGDWDVASTWQRFDGNAFVAAANPPSVSDGVITIRSGHIVTQPNNFTADQIVVEAGGTLAVVGSIFTLNDGAGTDLQVLGTCSLFVATLNGPGILQVGNGGLFTINNGHLNPTSEVNVLAGGTVNTNGSGTVSALGTIHNAGIWNMQGGNFGQPTAFGGACAFNNLPGGVVNLNGWQSTTNSWHQATVNQGTFNKNNGNTTFTFSADFGQNPKSFTNAAGGVLNVPAGECVFTAPTTNAGHMTGGSNGLIKHQVGGFTNQPGGTISGPFELAGALMTMDGALTLAAFTLSGGVVSGTEAINIPSGGQFTWTGGRLDGTSVLNILSGGMAVANGGTTLDALGTINNAGTWNLEGGNVGQSSFVGGPTTFNNLPGGVVNLNGWLTNSGTWHQVTNNQGTFNKNNGSTSFCFSNDFSGKAFHNLAGGVLNAPAGECVFKAPTTNAGSMTGTGNSLFTLDGGSFGGTFTNLAGGTVGAPFRLLTGLMHIEGGLVLNSFLFTGGVLHGPLALTIGSGGQFTWTGGTLSTSATLTIASNATGTLNGATLVAQGTINNGGQVTMQSGTITGLGSTPHLFNNLAGGVIDLNGWNTNGAAWHMVTSNAGTINKNNGAETFTFGDDFSFKSFTNQPGGVVNVPQGTLAFNLPFPLQNGTFNVASGATLTGINPFNFAGPSILNNGSITTPVLRYQGSSAQQLNGTGTVNSLAIDNAAGVDLGGDQTVTNILTMTNGPLRLGAHDLFVDNHTAGAVAGGSATSWVVNNGTGSLHRQVNGSGYLFPIGTSSYTPLTLNTTGPQDRFSARVQDGVSADYGIPGQATGLSIADHAVDRTWVVEEEVSGGNVADITVQWNAVDELPLFNRALCAVSRYDGVDWVTGLFAAAAGSDPYTRTLSGMNTFREFSVVDNLLDLNTVVDDHHSPASSVPRCFPQPALDVLHIMAPEGKMISGLRLIDPSGRLVIQANHLATERATLDIGGSPSGVYVIEWQLAQGGMGRAPVLIAH